MRNRSAFFLPPVMFESIFNTRMNYADTPHEKLKQRKPYVATLAAGLDRVSALLSFSAKQNPENGYVLTSVAVRCL